MSIHIRNVRVTNDPGEAKDKSRASVFNDIAAYPSCYIPEIWQSISPAENREPTLWDYKAIARITGLKHSSTSVLNQVADVADFKLLRFSQSIMAARVDNEPAWVPISSSTTSILSVVTGG